MPTNRTEMGNPIYESAFLATELGVPGLSALHFLPFSGSNGARVMMPTDLRIKIADTQMVD